jgi:2-(1,2-epoxy-1,2-dihydrophenyl)acetyl-CoA isomerase
MAQFVRYEIDTERGVATVTLDRPEKLNALNAQMIAEVKAALDDAERDPAVRAVVISGAGRAFCSGQQVTDLEAGVAAASNPPGRVSIPRPGAPLPIRLHSFPKPTVAAMHGVALGAGFDLALACDFRIAERSCRMGDWHVLRGYVPSASVFFLPRLVGVATALEMLSLGTVVEGEEAARLGLVNRCVPNGEALSEARAFADQLSRGPSITLQHIKRLIWTTEDLTLEQTMERVGFARAAAAPARESVEGMAAYRERRPADWRAAAR